MEIFKLMGSILVDSDSAEKSISKTETKANTLGKTLGGGIATAAKFGAALVAGAGVAIGGMFALGVKIGDTADTILDLNSITGMSTDAVQEWRKVAEVAGIGADSMTNASMKLTKSLDIMSTGTGKGAESLEKLGFSFEDIEAMSADERMNALTEALAGVDDKTERARIGTDLFGGSWKEIAPAVDLGAEAMQKAKDSANIISEDDLVKANNFRISVEDMKEKLAFFATEIGLKVMPALQTMMDWFADKMPLIQTIIETAMGYASEAIDKVGNVIETHVVPKLQSLYDWIAPNIPAIKAFIEDAIGVVVDLFEKLSEAVQFVVDNLNIFLPVMAGVTGAIVAQLVINSLVGAYKAWKAATVAQTTVQWLLNVALNANPLGLIAIAIGAVIAIGILLWKNWDVVKEKTLQLWDMIRNNPLLAIVAGPFGALIAVGVSLWKNWDTIKEKGSQLWSFLKNIFGLLKDYVVSALSRVATDGVQKFEELRSNAVAKINDLRTAVVNKIEEIRSNTINKISDLKNSVTGKFEDVRSAAVSKFNAVKDAITNPIFAARDSIKGAVDRIKGFFSGMSLNLPDIKTPHFKLKNWSKNPLDWINAMPSIGVDWYAKGGVFSKPTLFNTAHGLKGVGEAGPEAVLPLNDRVLGSIGKQIANTMGGNGQPTYGAINITIPASDIKEFADVTDFFKRLPQVVNQY